MRVSIKSKNLPNRSNGDQYFYIDDFNQVDEKVCLQYDKLNEKIYLEQLKLFNQITKKIKMSNIRIIEQPPAPIRPNNYEKLILWRKRHERLSVEDQTVSILYLLSKNIKIKLPNMYDDGIEPYNAIKKSNDISSQSREDKYIVAKHFVEKKFIENIIVDDESDELLGFNFLNRETSTDNTEDDNNIDNTKMICKHPEHHHIEEKVDHFNNFEREKRSFRKNSSRRKKYKSTSLYPNLDENKSHMNINLDREKENYFNRFSHSKMFMPNNYPEPSAPPSPPTYN
uniref:Uncharacterized protein n=1 Tax=viral metagenome TaxID=1070528 RepID=A0A6C0J5S8_9ZZZZ